jgi:flagellar motor switch protein FliM
MNLAIPSIFVKRLRGKFDQLRNVRRAASTEEAQARLATLLEDAKVTFEARIDAGQIAARTLLDLNSGDVLMLDHELERPIHGNLNGVTKWSGEIEVRDEKLAFRVDKLKPSNPALP